MHNNFYFLRQISAGLQSKLVGFTLVSCFSQSKDEIVFEFNNAKKSMFIRADLQGDFSCLTFPETFRRARKNSVDLFDEVIMKKVVSVRQYENERSFSIGLEDQLSILFKMHGNQSNVVLLKDNEEVDRFKKDVPGGAGTDREIDWSREAFEKNIDHPERLYFTFGRKLITNDWNEIQETKKKLEHPMYYILRDNKISFSLLPARNVIAEFDDPFKAINEFYSKYVTENSFVQKKNSLTARLKKEITQTRSWLSKTNSKLEELQIDDHYKSWGDLLMANLHLIESGAKSTNLENFYNENALITIPLDPNLSPQKNAERYYRKNKNQQIEIAKLREGLNKRQKQLAQLEIELTKAEEATDARSLPVTEETQSQGTVTSLPFWEFEYKGFTIWVGRDAKNNDELTLRWAHKNDLWLHVRDVPGSHVIIRHKAGKPFPKDVIEYAAGIAAFNSKRKTETLAPVIVTPKKFVRKRKGDPAGSVVVEREEVILVVPRNPAT